MSSVTGVTMYEEAGKRIRRVWLDVAIFGIPLVSIALLVTGYFAEVRIDIGYPLQFERVWYWTGAVAVMLGGFLGAKLLGDRLLAPERIAHKNAAGAGTNDISGRIALAETELKERIFIQLGVLDSPAVLLLLHSLLSGSRTSAAVALAYCAVAFTALRPDAEGLLKATVRELEKNNLAQRGA